LLLASDGRQRNTPPGWLRELEVSTPPGDDLLVQPSGCVIWSFMLARPLPGPEMAEVTRNQKERQFPPPRRGKADGLAESPVAGAAGFC